jgi:hypothetical protein
LMAESYSTQKFCADCDKNVETYWELCFCDKNEDGLSSGLVGHGNEIDGCTTCEDDYCRPDHTEVDKDRLSPEYIRTHEVDERCSECHQFMECMG